MLAWGGLGLIPFIRWRLQHITSSARVGPVPETGNALSGPEAGRKRNGDGNLDHAQETSCNFTGGDYCCVDAGEKPSWPFGEGSKLPLPR
ncbi:hypothetical protein KL929_003981 [Ogataea haglerorum]|nr:hypothetical protein KL929_003981 [Ogataea haglerorum]